MGTGPGGLQIARHLKRPIAAVSKIVRWLLARADSGFCCEAVQASMPSRRCSSLSWRAKTARLVEQLRAAPWKPSPKPDADGQCEFTYQPKGWGKGQGLLVHRPTVLAVSGLGGLCHHSFAVQICRFLSTYPRRQKIMVRSLGQHYPKPPLTGNDGHESRRYLSSHAMALRRRDPQQGKCYRRKFAHIERFHQQKALGFNQREVGR